MRIAARRAACGRSRLARWLGLALPVTLAACGGATRVESTGPDAGMGARLPEPVSDAAVAAVLAAPAAEKASPFRDAAAVTRPGLYATPSQAARTLAARPGAALRVRVDPGGWDAAELAVRIVWGEQAAADLPADVPVFVSGEDLRLAATVVDRLAESGLRRVFLVGPVR